MSEALGSGSTWDVDVSHDQAQKHLFVPDGTNMYVWTLLRKSGEILDRFGRNGRNAGQFHWVHNVAVDSKGNLYTAEVDTGKRVQKFSLKDDDPAAATRTRTRTITAATRTRTITAEIGRADRHQEAHASNAAGAAGRRPFACVPPGQAVLGVLLSTPARAHDIPDEILLRGFIKPEGDRLHFLVRVPLVTPASMNLPKRGPG